jgi:hypothetical protein
MEEINIIAFEKRDNKIYDFGLLRISEKEYLLRAAELEKFDNTVHISSHQNYEKKPDSIIPSGIKSGKISEFRRGRPFGYCKSSECRKPTNAKWSAQFGDEVGYNCIDCLSNFIYNARNNLRGSNIPIRFMSDSLLTEEKGSVQLLIEFKEKGVSINNSEPIPYKIYNTEIGKIRCEVYDIPPDLKTVVIPKKIYIGTIKGRHVCENIIFGNTCLSMIPDYSPATFLARSIPPGVPGWGEGKDDHDAKKCGKISVYKFCPACAIQQQNKQNSWSKNTNSISEFVRDSPSTAIDYWKKKYREAQMENADLRIKVAELQAQVKNQQYL